MIHVRICCVAYRCDHAAAVVGYFIYIFGGCVGEDAWLDDLHYLDTMTLTWTEVSRSGYIPQARALHTLTAHGGKDIYVLGGEASEQEDMDEVVKYSIGKYIAYYIINLSTALWSIGHTSH